MAGTEQYLLMSIMFEYHQTKHW